MAKLKKPKFRTAAQFAAQRGGGNLRGAGGYKPGLQSQINQGNITFSPVKSLGFKRPQFSGGAISAPRGGGIQRGGRTVVPKAPAGQWWDEDYQAGQGGNVQDLIDQGILNPDDVADLGYTRNPLWIEGSGSDIGAGDIEGDWEMQAALADLEAANRADEIGAKANIEALATGWGGDLSGLVAKGLISQATADAAKANEFSSMNQLGRQLSTGLGQGYNQLAARGIISSGAMPALTGELNRQYQQETTTGLQGLMQNIGQIRNQQASAAAERRGGLQGVRASIASRLAGLPQYQKTPRMQAFWDAETGSYVDDWGRRFDKNGGRVG